MSAVRDSFESAPVPASLRVIIGDPDGLARRMLRDTLQSAPGTVVVACAGSAEDARDLAGHYRPDVLVLDTAIAPDRMPELVADALARSPSTSVLTMSAGEHPEEMLAALRAGAVGHIGKEHDPGDLGRLLARVAAGEAVVPRRLVMTLLEQLRELPDVGWRPLHSRLTTREWEIVELLAQGASTECIADRLVLSMATVYSHVKHLLRKLGVSCREDAVCAAERLRREEVSAATPHAA